MDWKVLELSDRGDVGRFITAHSPRVGKFEDCFPYYYSYGNSNGKRAWIYRTSEALVIRVTTPGGGNRIYPYCTLPTLYILLPQFPTGSQIFHSSGTNMVRQDTVIELATVVRLEGSHYKNVRRDIASFKRKNPQAEVRKLSESDSNAMQVFLANWAQTQGMKYGHAASINKEVHLMNDFLAMSDFEDIFFYGLFVEGMMYGLEVVSRQGRKDTSSSLVIKALPLLNGSSYYMRLEVMKQLLAADIRYDNVESADQSPGVKHFKESFSLEKLNVCTL